MVTIAFVGVFTVVSLNINEVAKAILYIEEGEIERAYQKISDVGEENNTPTMSIIIAKVRKDEQIIKEKIEELENKDQFVVSEIKDGIEKRMKYELAKILFEKGEFEEAKKLLEELIEGEFVSYGLNFMLANIYLNERKYKSAKKFIADIKSDEIKASQEFKNLKKRIDEEASWFFPQAKVYSSASFSSPGPPIMFENERYTKRWDILSQFHAVADGRFIIGKISPFISYEVSGEFYTEIDPFAIQRISAGVEHKWGNIFGGNYSIYILTRGNRVFSIRHEFSPYIFAMPLYSRLKFGYETSDLLPLSGPVASAEGGTKITPKRTEFIGILEIGKRFGESAQFSELFISPYITGQIKMSQYFRAGMEILGSIMLYPDEFEGRKRNILWTVSPYVSMNRDLVEWNIISVFFEGNSSDEDKFSWSRLRFGTSLSFVF